MKSFGKMSSESSGDTNTFANGVAVYPTYWARGRTVSSSAIAALILAAGHRLPLHRPRSIRRIQGDVLDVVQAGERGEHATEKHRHRLIESENVVVVEASDPRSQFAL